MIRTLVSSMSRVVSCAPRRRRISVSGAALRCVCVTLASTLDLQRATPAARRAVLSWRAALSTTAPRFNASSDESPMFCNQCEQTKVRGRALAPHVRGIAHRIADPLSTRAADPWPTAAQDSVGCTTVGVCGKTPEVAALQDLLIYAARGLAEVAHHAGGATPEVNK